MKKRILGLVLALCIIFCAFPSFAQREKADIIILFENDVHCSLDGYTKLAALKDAARDEADYVGVVSSGDFIQGGNAGVASKGEYIVKLMNLVGYDAVAAGNHEFDYKLPRLFELEEMLGAPIVCANFKDKDGNSIFSPYEIVSYGDIDVAYIGMITPSTIASSAPTQFMDDEGNYIYNFSGNDLSQCIQESIDKAKEEGADYIIALSHLGTEEYSEDWRSYGVVKNTTGIDVVLDAHSHSVIPSMTAKDKDGNDVIIASTGTAFANIGKLTIDDGIISTELIPTENLDVKNEKVSEYTEQINSELEAMSGRVVGKSEVFLSVADEDGNRIIRTEETNLGNLCADAYRIVTGANIGVMNGGGIRTDIKEGEITFNDLLAVFPFNNYVCVAEVTGQQILDYLEHGVRALPLEEGGFPHTSGLKFEINKDIESSVVLDENENFVSVNGARRIQNVTILNEETGAYEKLIPEKIYTLAGHNYLLLEGGDGAAMFRGAKSVEETGMLDVELLNYYVEDYLEGVIGKEYAQKEGRIKFVTGETADKNFDDVAQEDWFYDAVKYSVEKNFFTGTSENTFSPSEAVTRAMLITVLYRAEDEPPVNRSIPFSDMELGSYYQSAAIWAQQVGIITGVEPRKLAPHQSITREQVAAIMHRYANFKGMDISVSDSADVFSYNDASEISEYAVEAMQYALESGLLRGKTQTTLNPLDSLTRAELATILMRFMK